MPDIKPGKKTSEYVVTVLGMLAQIGFGVLVFVKTGQIPDWLFVGLGAASGGYGVARGLAKKGG